jgi:hypothetical protein
VPIITAVGLHQLAQVKKMAQNLLRDFHAGVLSSGIVALDPLEVPPQDADAHQPVEEGGLAVVLLGCKCIPLCCYSLLPDAEVNPIDCQETVVEDITFLSTVKVNV